MRLTILFIEYNILYLPFSGTRKKNSPSIIRRRCAFESKNRGFSRMSEFVSAYMERDKKFFRKIQFSHFLPSFFAEKYSIIDAQY